MLLSVVQPREINDNNRAAVLEWLNDRRDFHKWFSSLIVGSFVIFSVFGNKPGLNDIGPIFLSISSCLFLFSVICNLVSVWSIPTWKYGVITSEVADTKRLHLELSVTSWIGVVSFVCGLTLGSLGNLFF